MPHNTDRILTTHVGSLIRPPKLIESWQSIEDGKPYDEAAFRADKQAEWSGDARRLYRRLAEGK